MFTRFAEMQSIRQVNLSLRNHGIALPCVSYSRKGRSRHPMDAAGPQ
jgi:hypothetical protein